MNPTPLASPQEQWLERYFYARAAFSIGWVAIALSVARRQEEVAAERVYCSSPSVSARVVPAES